MTHYICQTCGGQLEQNEDGNWECKYCHNVYQDESARKNADLLRSLLDEIKIEKVANLRRNLYDSIKAKYTDSEEICRICGEIKKYLPDDFMANFYYTANHGTPADITKAIREIDATENAEYISDIVEHIVASLRTEYTFPLQNLVERAFKNTDMTKFEQLSTLISDEAVKIDAGIYETSVPREVFVAYSSRDMEKVEELVEYLEFNGLDCFVAVRNLRHGRGAKQSYEIALHEAMENCNSVVFVSSHNSRSMECDALSVELKYIKNMDLLGAPAEFRKNYAAMPYKYKKNRVEYRIDNEKSQVYAEKTVAEFFAGLEYACSPEEVVSRLYSISSEEESVEEEIIPTENTTPVKYCASCGAECPEETKFCTNCGNREFVATMAEYNLKKAETEAAAAKELEEKKLALQKEREEFERKKRQAEEEAKRIEEEKKKAAEEKRRLEEQKRKLEAEKRAAANKTTTTSTYTNNSYSGNKSTTSTTKTTNTTSTYTPPKKKKKKTFRKLVIWGIILYVLFTYGKDFAMDIWYNQIAPNFTEETGYYHYTPELIRSYSGSYSTWSTEGEAVLTFTECTDDGKLSGYIEFITGGNYGKYEITGYIDDKDEHGVVVKIVAGDWVIQPSGYDPLATFYAKITNNYQDFTCEEYNMYWNSETSNGNMIDSAESLRALSGKSGIFNVRADIDLGGDEWTPIENFSGILLGNGHTISNFKVVALNNNAGLFASFMGTASDLKITGAEIVATETCENVGIFCGFLNGSLNNVSVEGSIDAQYTTRVGGIAGCVEVVGNVTMENLTSNATVIGETNVGGIFGSFKDEGPNNRANVCLNHFENNGEVTATGDFAGGIIGNALVSDIYNNNEVLLTLANAVNTGNVSGNDYVGGIVGYAVTSTAGSVITGSENCSKVSGNAFLGCIAGYVDRIQIESCKNDGSTLESLGFSMEDGEIQAYAGGFAGYGYSFKFCNNTVNVESQANGNYVGGICGFLSHTKDFTVESLTNTASVSGGSYVGGIFGCVLNEMGNNSGDVLMKSLENSGSISASGNCAGGIIGGAKIVDTYNNYKVNVTVTSSINTGAVKGELYVGGIVGYLYSNSTDSVISLTENRSDVTGKAYIGCIAGWVEKVQINSCKNEGSKLIPTGYLVESGAKNVYMGGFAGRGYTFSDCSNSVPLTAKDNAQYVGGICGIVNHVGSYSMSNLSNHADIKGGSYVGGIFGAVLNDAGNNKSEVTFDAISNSGRITGAEKCIGGLFGCILLNDSYNNYQPSVTVTNSENAAEVSGTDFVGGLVGYGKTLSPKSAIIGFKALGKVTGKANYGATGGKLVSIAVK